jgi:hypothetical protein
MLLGSRSSPRSSQEDLAGIRDLLLQAGFSTREEAFLAESPETKAVNAVTLVEKLDKRLPELQVKARYYDLGALPPELDRAHLRRRASRPSPTTRTTT